MTTLLIYQIDLSTLISPTSFHITLSADLYTKIAARFKIPEISHIEIRADLVLKDNLWVFAGSISSDARLKCVQSNILFQATFNAPFSVVLSHHELNDDFLDVELLEGSKVDLGEIAIQYLALEIPLSPISPEIYEQNLGHRAASEITEDYNPEWKSILQKLKK